MSIRDLIDAVERGEFPHGINGAARKVFPYAEREADDLGLTAAAAFDGSVDAALALMRAVLPGVPVCIHDMSQDYLGGQGWVAKVNWPHTVWQPTFTAAGPFAHEGRADTPARALLLAILKAKLAEMEAGR